MKTSEITQRESHLIELYHAKQEATTQYTEAIQYAALQAETSPAVVSRYIRAMATEKANAVAHEAAQLAMLFDAIPTLTEGLDGVTVTVMQNDVIGRTQGAVQMSEQAA